MKRLTPILVFVLVMAACSRHDSDLPQPLPIIEPPTPINFIVSTQDSIVYDLSWDVEDPSVVSYYRVYTQVLIPYVEPQIDTTTVTSVHVDLGLPLPVGFCVSSISVENVESRLNCATGE
ncbi:MAG: hypothetical protein JSW58_13850 [Candidatus Latescibacterota bacterium]|nr:MAG: hypothetical protein JSW58_13850 [Candidatus Latescibacterota bacterium]